MIQAGDGADEAYGDSGDDKVQGGLGNDVVDGGSGNDLLAANLLYTNVGDPEVKGLKQTPLGTPWSEVPAMIAYWVVTRLTY